MKKIVMLLLVYFLSAVTFAKSIDECPNAYPTSHQAFCSSFVESAKCNCLKLRKFPVPKSLCNDMKKIYKGMLFKYGTQSHACQNQTATSYQTCMDDWNCYHTGGRDSRNNLCSSTGRACQKFS